MNKKRKVDFHDSIQDKNIDIKEYCDKDNELINSSVNGNSFVQNTSVTSENEKKASVSSLKYTSRLSLKSKTNNEENITFASIFKSSNKCVGETPEEVNEDQFAPKLSNLGNSCYLNVVINALFSTCIFVQHISELDANINETIANMISLSSIKSSTFQQPHALPKSWKLIRNLNELFLKMRKCLIENSNCIKPNDLLNTLYQLNENFIINEQQDAHEVLRFVLETLREAILELNGLRRVIESYVTKELNKISSKLVKNIQNKCAGKKKATKKSDVKENIQSLPSLESKKLIFNFFKKTDVIEEDVLNSVNCRRVENFVSNLFIGLTSNSTRCLECETVSTTTQEFLDFGIDVAQKSKSCSSTLVESDDEVYENCKEEFMSRTTDDWVERNMKEIEIICSENKFFCSICTQYVEAEKISQIVHAPRLLIVNLKRFASSFSGCYTKCNESFDIPLTIRCVQHNCKNINHRYELYAIISHAGFSILSGHYTAFIKIKNCYKNAEINEPKILTDNKYVTNSNKNDGPVNDLIDHKIQSIDIQNRKLITNGSLTGDHQMVSNDSIDRKKKKVPTATLR